MSEGEDIHSFLPENMFPVLDQLKQCDSFLKTSDTQELCKVYAKLFPTQDGMYNISNSHITALSRAMWDKTLLDLVDKGLLEMLWDDDKNDFAFKLTEAGKKSAQQLPEE